MSNTILPGATLGILGSGQLGRMFAITVLGGMGSIGGTLVAAVILGLSESLMATFFGPSWSLAVSFGLLLTVLAVAVARADSIERRMRPQTSIS